MVRQQLEKDLKNTIGSLGFRDVDIVLSIPENPSFGDYTTNVALQLSNQKSKNSNHSPQQIASQILEKFGHPHYLERIEIAGPGFLNFFLKGEALIGGLNADVTGKQKSDSSKKILVEFAHPNTHKAFHIGHFRNISIGESISRILEHDGVDVFRTTYGGDIGPHVAKALWGVLSLAEEYDQIKNNGSLQAKAEFLGKAYAKGAKAYEEDEAVKAEINKLNGELYGKKPEIVPLWEVTKNWSIAYFDSLYSKLGTEFDAEIWESEVEVEGKSIVEQNLGKIFIKDQGAIIFPGDKFGLHNRVFITSAGYPTYEAKELGLTRREEELFPFEYSLHVVANEQADFFKVVNKAIQLIDQRRDSKKKHLSYGMVNLITGKMSSRKGEVITAEQLIEQVKEKLTQIVDGSHLASKQSIIDKVAIGAIKFSYLKFSPQKDIAFDIDQSVSLQGDSGPYVQYTYARTQSLIEKAGDKLRKDTKVASLDPEEREVLRQIEYFEYVTNKAANELEATILTTYLLDLAKAFNFFYQKHSVIGSEKEAFRLNLVSKTGEILKEGLYLLGIEAPERM